MKRNLKYLLGFLFVLQTTLAQDTITYDRSKISTKTELNFAFTNARGIESKTGTIYYVERDKKTLTAYEKGKFKWQINIINICGEPAIGPSEIRYLKLDNDTIRVAFGKHSFVNIEISKGKTTCLGAD